MSSLKNKSFCPDKQGSGVDLVLSCVDNYEARMAVNQVFITKHLYGMNELLSGCFGNFIFG